MKHREAFAADHGKIMENTQVLEESKSSASTIAYPFLSLDETL